MATKKTTRTAAKPRKKTTSKPKAVKKLTKTKAELMCEGVSDDIKAQATTLANAVLSMQEKIEQQIPVYREQPLAQQVTVGTGETGGLNPPLSLPDKGEEQRVDSIRMKQQQCYPP